MMMGFDTFNLIATLMPIFFLIVLGIIVFNLVSGIKKWNDNNHQPVLTVNSKVVTKRTAVSGRHHNHNGHAHFSSNTRYYTTFEVESGDRMELQLSGRQYGQIAEGDVGKLTFQGTRFKGFQRMGVTQ
jgi:hypothetical protein